MLRTGTLTEDEKKYYMEEAIKEAKIAESYAEVPIGAVVVREGIIIGRGHNLREKTQIATVHAEMQAIEEACKTIGNWRLEECKLFVTLEPCPMCSGALILSRMAEVYIGAMDPKAGTVGSLMNLLTDERFNHQPYVETGILRDACGQLLTDFFKGLREAKKIKKKGTSKGE